jgi:hypothetical protein
MGKPRNDPIGGMGNAGTSGVGAWRVTPWLGRQMGKRRNDPIGGMGGAGLGGGGKR